MSRQWYYIQSNQRVGPVSDAELKVLATNGQLLRTDFVWTDTFAEWVVASTIDGLFPATAIPEPPVKQPPPFHIVSTPSSPTNNEDHFADLTKPPERTERKTTRRKTQGLDNFLPKAFLQLLSNPLVAIGLTVGIIALSAMLDILLEIENSRITFLPVLWGSAFIIYYDASSNLIGRIPTRKSKSFFNFTNNSAGIWALGAVALWLVIFPLYFIKRQQLIALAATKPRRAAGVGFKLTALGLLTIGSTIVGVIVLRHGLNTKEQAASTTNSIPMPAHHPTVTMPKPFVADNAVIQTLARESLRMVLESAKPHGKADAFLNVSPENFTGLMRKAAFTLHLDEHYCNIEPVKRDHNKPDGTLDYYSLHYGDTPARTFLIYNYIPEYRRHLLCAMYIGSTHVALGDLINEDQNK